MSVPYSSFWHRSVDIPEYSINANLGWEKWHFIYSSCSALTRVYSSVLSAFYLHDGYI